MKVVRSQIEIGMAGAEQLGDAETTSCATSCWCSQRDTYGGRA